MFWGLGGMLLLVVSGIHVLHMSHKTLLCQVLSGFEWGFCQVLSEGGMGTAHCVSSGIILFGTGPLIDLILNSRLSWLTCKPQGSTCLQFSPYPEQRHKYITPHLVSTWGVN